MRNVGKILRGLCDGMFGINPYSDKRIEAEGVDWIIVRELKSNSEPLFASFANEKHKETFIEMNEKKIVKYWKKEIRNECSDT